MTVRAVFLATLLLASPARAADYFLYAGSYTAATSKGIYAWRFSSENGALQPMGLMAATPNPAHIWATPDNRFLYAVNWQGSATERGDTVSAFAIDRRTGALSLLDTVGAGGVQPNQVMVDPSGKVALTVTYNSGTVSAFRIAADGRLGEAFYTDTHTGAPIDPKQTIARAHGIQVSRDGRYVFVAELGLDRIYSYRLNAAAPSMTPFETPYLQVKAGTAPRRLQLSPDGRFLYVNGQNDSSVMVLRVRGGNLKLLQQISTLPPDFKGANSTAEIKLDRKGRFLYVSNRGRNSICQFAVDARTGLLTRIENVPAMGRVPRNIAIDPGGRYLFAADQDTDNIVEFAIDPKSGRLTAAGRQQAISQPGSLTFVPVIQ